jgi:hypothetical protein
VVRGGEGLCGVRDVFWVLRTRNVRIGKRIKGLDIYLDGWVNECRGLVRRRLMDDWREEEM